jgi:hypothetical protein
MMGWHDLCGNEAETPYRYNLPRHYGALVATPSTCVAASFGVICGVICMHSDIRVVGFCKAHSQGLIQILCGHAYHYTPLAYESGSSRIPSMLFIGLIKKNLKRLQKIEILKRGIRTRNWRKQYLMSSQNLVVCCIVLLSID